MPSVIVNGTELYYEIRGTGPAVLLIMGATGDGGHFYAVAGLLADEFMAVTRASPAAARHGRHPVRGRVRDLRAVPARRCGPGGAIAVPVRLLVSQDGLPVFAEIAARLGQRLGVDVATAPGTHATYHEHPGELADIVRPFLRQVSEKKS